MTVAVQPQHFLRISPLGEATVFCLLLPQHSIQSSQPQSRTHLLDKSTFTLAKCSYYILSQCALVTTFIKSLSANLSKCSPVENVLEISRKIPLLSE